MTELLDWIARNQGAAVGLGFFLLVFFMIAAFLASDFFDFLHNALCAFTGKYPAPRPHVDCSHTFPCKCCRENACQANCDCWSDKEETEYIENA